MGFNAKQITSHFIRHLSRNANSVASKLFIKHLLKRKSSKKIIKHLSKDNEKIKAVLNELALQDEGACSELIRKLMGSTSASSTAPPEESKETKMSTPCAKRARLED